MKKATKKNIKLIGALELERQQKQQLENTNYSLQLNFAFFEGLIKKPTKHHGDLENLKKFIRHIPYLKSITATMSNRWVDKFLPKLQIKQYQAGEHTTSEFQIILSGEVVIKDRDLVQTDTFQEVAKTKKETIVLLLNQEAYENLIQEYHENLLNQKLEKIKLFSVFSHISLNRLKAQLDQFKEDSYQIGNVLYKENMPVEFVYLLLEGEIKLIQDELELQLCTSTTMIGEMELIESKDKRIHRAIVTQESKVYKIQSSQLKYVLQISNLYEQFAQNYQEKELFWRQRKFKYKKVQAATIDYSEFRNTIPKTYQNYFSSTKLRGREQIINLDQQLKEAKKEKFEEAFKQFSNQIKLNFKTNYSLRKLLIQAKQANHDLPIMRGLKLEKYIPKYTFEHKKTQKIMDQFNQSESKEYLKFVSDMESRTTTITKPTRLQSALQSRIFSGKATPTNKQNKQRPTTAVAIGKRNARVQSDFQLV